MNREQKRTKKKLPKNAMKIRIRVEAEKAMRQDEQERQERRDQAEKIQHWKDVILEQIAELKQRRKEEENVKREVADEQARQKAMDDMERKRRKIDERRRAQ